MQTDTSATVVATTARSDVGTLFASLELSKSKWLVTVNSPGGEKFSRHVVEGGDGGALLGLLERLRSKAEQRCGRSVKVMVIQEAGLDGFWLHRLLADSGIESHVVDPASIAVDRRHRRAKTDAIGKANVYRERQALTMARRCCGRSWPGPEVSGGSARWFERPSPEEEDQRRFILSAHRKGSRGG